MDVKKELLDLMAEYIDLPEDEINFDEPMKMSAGINSFVFLSMVTAIEERFDIKIPNDKLSEFKTLSDIVNFVEKLKQ